jgi:hypothetical protein
MLGYGSTTLHDYPEWSGLVGQESMSGSPAAAAAGEPPIRIYIIGDDRITRRHCVDPPEDRKPGEIIEPAWKFVKSA